VNENEPNIIIEEPSVVTPEAGVEAEQYVAKELIRVRKALRMTQVMAVTLCVLTVVSMGTITYGFAQSLEPHHAATIAQGLISEHVDDQIPQFKQYIKEKVPVLISQVPGYVKQQLPQYRENLESRLGSALDHYAEQTSQQFDTQFDAFVTANQPGIKALMSNSQDPEAMKALDTNLKQMREEYVDHTEVNGETLQSQIGQSLAALTEIDGKMKRLAANKNLTDEEKKTRRAIAILLKSVDTNPSIAQARAAVDNLKQNGAQQVQTAVQGVLTYTGSGEATFAEPGKPPTTFLLKKAPVVSQPVAKTGLGMASKAAPGSGNLGAVAKPLPSNKGAAPAKSH
jgi:hypothetical protein